MRLSIYTPKLGREVQSSFGHPSAHSFTRPALTVSVVSARNYRCLIRIQSCQRTKTLMAERAAEEKRGVRAPNLAERVKEEVHSIAQTPKHGKETHGTSDDIDEDTPVDEVKGPGVFHRMKEEVEAIVEAIHPKNKDSPSHK